jgi:hypothetical protein
LDEVPGRVQRTRIDSGGAVPFGRPVSPVITRPDTDGRLLPMIKNMAEYARSGDKINHADVEKILSIIERAVSDGSYLALAPQFVVTGTR